MTGQAGRRVGFGMAIALVAVLAGASRVGFAQQGKIGSEPSKPTEVYLPIPGFDTTSIDKTVDPCNDFYKICLRKVCGESSYFPQNQPGVDEFYALYNVNTQALNGILKKAAAGWGGSVGPTSRRSATTTRRA